MSLPTLSPDTAALVDALERVSDRAGTLALFDALILESPEGVAAALGADPSHPMAVAVIAWLNARGVEGPRPPTVEEVLRQHGIVDLQGHLSAAAKQTATLQRGLDSAWERAARAETAANAYAAILVLFTLLAVVGWAAALGVIPLFEEAVPPKAPPKAAPPSPRAENAR